MLEVFCCSLLVAGMESFISSKKNIEQYSTNELNLWDEYYEISQISRLAQTLEMINKIDDSQGKVMLLNDLALSYAKLGEVEQAKKILAQSLSITENFEDVSSKITTITEIADAYYKIGEIDKASTLLENTIDSVNSIDNKILQQQLLLKISLKYGEIGQEEKSEMLLTQSQETIMKASQTTVEFPFQQTGSRLNLGLTGNVGSFRDTTARLGVRTSFYQQWPEQDIYLDGNLSVSYDSDRSVNNYRPSSFIKSVYRRHFNPQWNFFTGFFNSTNQDLFASENDSEDLSIISNLIVGAGLNLWRGDSIRQFLDIQLGVGPRYEYEYIDFQKRRDEIDPTVALLLFGRGFAIDSARINQTFAIIPSVDDFNNYTITSDTDLSIPISDRWSLSNRIFFRYRNDVVVDQNPNLEFLFTTGVNYRF
ncbi:MAG: DUF481 domain-containing protein [Crocosphaera sp.]